MSKIVIPNKQDVLIIISENREKEIYKKEIEKKKRLNEEEKILEKEKALINSSKYLKKLETFIESVNKRINNDINKSKGDIMHYIKVRYDNSKKLDASFIIENDIQQRLITLLKFYEENGWYTILERCRINWNHNSELKIGWITNWKYSLSIRLSMNKRQYDEHALYQTPSPIYKEDICVICSVEKPTVLYISCGHLICCDACHKKYTQRKKKKCPICNELIVVKTGSNSVDRSKLGSNTGSDPVNATRTGSELGITNF